MELEQIIKALECCSSKIGCKECPLKPRESVSICITQISKYALSLIKELTEENERLRADDSELLNEFMNWLQDNKHINKSVEYRNELCEMFINDRRLNK